MELLILGSGTMVVKKDRHPTSFLVKIGGELFLLDCGHTTLARMVELEIDYQKINFIGITHTHTDHIADLMPIVHSQFVAGIFDEKKRRRKKLHIFGPVGIGKAWQKLREVMWPEPHEDIILEVETCTSNQFSFPKFSLETLAVKHTDFFNSIAFKLTSYRKSLVYTGDLNPNQSFRNLIDFAKGSDLFIVDAGRPSGFVGNHLTPAEAGTLASQAQVKELLLTHLLDRNSEEKIREEVKRTYRGKTTLAKDLLKIKI